MTSLWKWRILPLLALLATGGCGNSPPMAEVEGVLVIGGKPGRKVLLQFIPDVDKGSTGPVSMAETNSEGQFVLSYRETNEAMPRSGAVIGWHRVVLTDQQLAESATGKGIPIRMTPEYGLANSTPLRQEVKAGKQVIEIRLP